MAEQKISSEELRALRQIETGRGSSRASAMSRCARKGWLRSENGWWVLTEDGRKVLRETQA